MTADGDNTQDVGPDDNNDSSDFMDAMAGVAPLQKGNKAARLSGGAGNDLSAAALDRRQQAAQGLLTTEDDNPLTLGEVPQLHPHDVLTWKKDGVQNEVFTKLRTGGYELEAQLDLHGLSVKEARVAVYKLLQFALAKGFRSALIAHGRGERSQTPARLKSYLAYWLEAHDDVLAFHSAQRFHGGTGAVYALLRKSPAKKAETRERYGLKGSEQDPLSY